MKRYELYKEEEFISYLVSECNKSVGTAKSYISYINSISIELDIEEEFYSEIAIEASAVTYLEEILGLLAVVREFSKCDKTRKNWMSGLKSYIDFRNKASIYETYEFEALSGVEYAKEKFMIIFKSRLNTQNREYSNGVCYMPTIFAKIEKGFFAPNLQTQLSNIYTWVKVANDNYQRVNVMELDRISISERGLYGYRGGKMEPLYFKSDENSYSTFYGFISGIDTVSLGHTKSVWRVLNDSVEKYPTLHELSKIILLSGYDVKDIKYKYCSDAIVKKIKESSINIEVLRTELKEIDAELVCELMPLNINIAMGKY